MTRNQKTVKLTVLPEYKELYNPAWRYIVFHGGRGSGKSRAAADALIIRGRQKKLRILCTRELQNSIRDSVHKLLSDIIERHGFTDYEVVADSIRNKVTGTEFIFKGLRSNINEIKSMEGIDICWVEEAQAVTGVSWDVLTPTIRKPGSQIIITFNRLNELDPVWTRFCTGSMGSTYVAKVNSDVLEKYGLLPDVLKMERDHDKKTSPDLYAWKWLGEPMGQSDMAIMSKADILAAMEREASQEGAIEIGVDVARMGDDRTVFKKRKGMQIIDSKVLTHKKTTEVCDALEVFAGGEECRIKIDDTGVGGGVTDEMEKRGYNVVPVNFGASASEPDKYTNTASEMWFNLKAIIGEAGLGGMDSGLLQELSNREWQMDSKGRRGVEPKQKYKKRMGHSPDEADATILCFYNPPEKKQWATLSAADLF